jgi:carbamoyltransferase
MIRPFTVLGINYGGHDTSAALMREGELVAACEQERYTLDKHSRRFPVEAVQDCLDRVGIRIDEVDELAFAFQPLYHIREAYLQPALTDENRIGVLISDIDRIRDNYLIESLVRDKTGFDGNINYYHHHMCHLASAWYPSGFDEALVVSYDGIGEIESGLLAVGRDGLLEVFYKDARYPDSLGLLYSAITYHLGWRHHCDEGIIMGLACYGDPHEKVPGHSRTYYDVFCEIVRVTGDYSYEIDRDWISYHQVRDKWVSDQFCDVFGRQRDSEDELTIHHKHIAAALQLRLEEVVLAQMQKAQQQYQVNRLCISGGVGLNCSMNGKIEQSRIFDEIFVQPASGDAGVAAGACYLGHKAYQSSYRPVKMHNFYLGSVFGDNDIVEAFAKLSIDAIRPDDLFERTAERLAEGKIVGWFQRGAEFGPRALGNRSILTRPFPATMKDYLNTRVKFREEFRPFAPAVLAEHAAEYFEIRQESPHMLIACRATEKAKKEIPATVHVDDSCRVQTVKPDNNERFHRLLVEFQAKTGCPVILNTSFNIKGQPIVNTPEQAIDCYLSTNIDCLVVGDFFVEKNQT